MANRNLPNVVKGYWDYTAHPRFSAPPAPLVSAPYTTNLIVDTNNQFVNNEGSFHNEARGTIERINTSMTNPTGGYVVVPRITTGNRDSDPTQSRMGVERFFGMTINTTGQRLKPGTYTVRHDHRPISHGTRTNPVNDSRIMLTNPNPLGLGKQGKKDWATGHVSMYEAEYCYIKDASGNMIVVPNLRSELFTGAPTSELIHTSVNYIEVSRGGSTRIVENQNKTLRKFYNRYKEPIYLDAEGGMYEPYRQWGKAEALKDSKGRKFTDKGFNIAEFPEVKQEMKSLFAQFQGIQNILNYLPSNYESLERWENDNKRQHPKMEDFYKEAYRLAEKNLRDRDWPYYASLEDSEKKKQIDKLAEGIIVQAKEIREEGITDEYQYYKDRQVKSEIGYRQFIEYDVDKDGYVYLDSSSKERPTNHTANANLSSEHKYLLRELARRGIVESGYMHFTLRGKEYAEDKHGNITVANPGTLTAVTTAKHIHNNFIPANFGNNVKYHNSFAQYNPSTGEIDLVPANEHNGAIISKGNTGLDHFPAYHRICLNTMEIYDPRTGFRPGQAYDIGVMADGAGRDLYIYASENTVDRDESNAMKDRFGGKRKYYVGMGPTLGNNAPSELVYSGSAIQFVKNTEKTWAAKLSNWLATWFIEVDEKSAGTVRSTWLSSWVLGIDFGKIYRDVRRDLEKLNSPQEGLGDNFNIVAGPKTRPIDVMKICASYMLRVRYGDENRVRMKLYQNEDQVNAREDNDIYQSMRAVGDEIKYTSLGMAMGGGVGLIIGSLVAGMSIATGTLPLLIGLGGGALLGGAIGTTRAQDNSQKYQTDLERNQGPILPGGRKQMGTIDVVRAQERLDNKFFNTITLGMEFKYNVAARLIRGVSSKVYRFTSSGTNKEVVPVMSRSITGCVVAGLCMFGGPIGIAFGVAVGAPTLALTSLYLLGKTHGKKEHAHYVMETSHGERLVRGLSEEESLLILPKEYEMGAIPNPTFSGSKTEARLLERLPRYFNEAQKLAQKSGVEQLRPAA